MAVKEVLVYPNHPILRQRAHKVRGLSQSQVRDIVLDLIDTAKDRNAAGLAAPQIGVAYRIIVVKSGPGYVGMINPEVTLEIGNSLKEEGCLSLPGLYIPVRRASKIRVKTANGKHEAEGDLARAILHEIDHLDGILILDKEFKTKEAGIAST